MADVLVPFDDAQSAGTKVPEKLRTEIGVVAEPVADSRVLAGFARRPRLADGIFSAVDAALAAGGNSTAVQVPGDSTANAPDEWVYLLSEWLADRHPDAHVKYKLWDDATQAYGAWSVLQAGASGERYALFTNNSRTFYLPYASFPHISGDIDIRVRVRLDDWTPASSQDLVAHYGAAGQRGFIFQVNSSGALSFLWTTDGTTNISRSSTGAAIADGTEAWVRVTLDVDNGSGGYTATFYKSTDGVTWTTITNSVVPGSTTSIFDASATDYEIGGRGLNAEMLMGRIYEVQIRDGIDGKIVNPQPIDSWTPRGVSGSYIAGTFGGSPTLYVLNGSKPGANLTYLADSGRLPKMIHPYAGSVVFQSCSHNDATTDVGAAYLTARKAFSDAIDARVPGCQQVILTQNPQIAPFGADYIQAHARRRKLLMGYAARAGLVVIDTYKAFLDWPAGVADLVEASDGVHPTAADGSGETGEEGWLKAITDAWDQVA
mgnify:FL=1